MTTVLVAVGTDGDDAVGQVEELLSVVDGASLEAWIVHVFTENTAGGSVAQMESAKRARERLDAAGADVTLRGESGDPADRLVAVAAELDVDAVCVGGRDRSPAGKALLGSVAQSVSLRVDRPVVFCPV